MTALIKPKETLLCKEPLIFIDTRSPETYAAGHIPGAVHMREIFNYVSMSTESELSTLQGKFATLFGAAGLSGQQRAVFYEDSLDTGNGQSCRGYFLLKYLGYPKASVLHGGYQEWLATGLPVTDKTTFPSPAAFPVSVNSSMMLTKAQMLDAIGNKQVAILDVRDSNEWFGDYATPSGQDPQLRLGRIPGAIWMEWRKLLDQTSSPVGFRPNSEIESICLESGITRMTPIYLYCFKGSRAASTYVALQQAGFTDVRNYFASWNEWARDPASPIDQQSLTCAQDQNGESAEARAA